MQVFSEKQWAEASVGVGSYDQRKASASIGGDVVETGGIAARPRHGEDLRTFTPQTFGNGPAQPLASAQHQCCRHRTGVADFI